MTEPTVVTTEVTIIPAGNDITDGQATRVRLADGGGGVFIEVEPNDPTAVDGPDHGISIDADEWPTLRRVIDDMASEAARLNAGDDAAQRRAEDEAARVRYYQGFAA